MKTRAILIATTLSLIVFGYTKQQLPQGITEEINSEKIRKVENKAFKDGEALHYRLHYGVINAGVAKLEVKKIDKKISGRDVYHVVGTGKSIGAFDWFFKVRDRYETFIDVDGLFPWLFLRDINEGGYQKQQKYKFKQTINIVEDKEGKEFEIPTGVQDMLSAFYYARSIDYTNAKNREVFTIWSFVDEELWPLKIRYLGKSTVKVNGKKYKALKFCPVVQEGRLFKDENDVSVWISDDENKIPLKAEGKVLIGSVKFELTKAEGLLEPLAKADD